jgi:hypothetical protein
LPTSRPTWIRLAWRRARRFSGKPARAVGRRMNPRPNPAPVHR